VRNALYSCPFLRLPARQDLKNMWEEDLSDFVQQFFPKPLQTKTETDTLDPDHSSENFSVEDSDGEQGEDVHSLLESVALSSGLKTPSRLQQIQKHISDASRCAGYPKPCRDILFMVADAARDQLLDLLTEKAVQITLPETTLIQRQGQ